MGFLEPLFCIDHDDMRAESFNIGASGSSTAQRDLFEPFLNVLSSGGVSDIPTDTLLGAITHFLSTSTDKDVTRLTAALLASTTVWDSEIKASQLREAVRLAVVAKVDMLRAEHERSWIPTRRISRDVRRWLRAITTRLDGREHPHNISATHIRQGLLSGLGTSGDVGCNGEVAELEEAVILALSSWEAELPTKTPAQGATHIDMMCCAVQLVSPDCLGVLNLPVSRT